MLKDKIDYSCHIQVRLFITVRNQVRDVETITIFHPYARRMDREKYMCLYSKQDLLAEVRKKLADWDIINLNPRFAGTRKGIRHLNYTLREVSVELANYKHYQRKKAIYSMLNKKMILA